MAYTRIEIDAPSSAVPDEYVEATVEVRPRTESINLHRLHVIVGYENVGGGWEKDPVTLVDEYRLFQYQAFNVLFKMRHCTVRLYVYVYYETLSEPGVWHFDNSDDVAIITSTPGPQCSEGETSCEGYDLCQCIDGKWQLVERDSAQCGYGAGNFELIQHTVYPWAYVYEGNAEKCTFQFKLTPEQVPGTEWVGRRIVDEFASELEKEGEKLLELKVYEDITPTLWTNYRVEVTASASPVPWTAIIYAVLAILFIVAITWAIKSISKAIFHRKPLSEETKRTFSRSTLTAMILDLSPATPPETLAAMSDQELRDLLNSILAQEAEGEVPWKWLAVGIGAAVLVGGAVVLLRK